MNTLMDRIEQGLTTVEDARTVSRIIARLANYEMALREIAAYGDGLAARTACQALHEEETT